MVVADREQRLHAAYWTDHADRMQRTLRARYAPLDLVVLETGALPAAQAFEDYFRGEFSALDALPVHLVGTAFQQQVWQALRTIPCGQTLSYSELARRIQRPSAVRAVGLANGSNPLSIVLPCHRVIGANGALTGYGGGLDRKSWLLHHERALREQALFASPHL